jgi:hypothetical protein
MIPLAAILSIGEKVLDKVLPNPEAKAEAQAKLMEMAQQGELAQLEAHVKDMQSARDREVQIATSANAPTLNKIVHPCWRLAPSLFRLFCLQSSYLSLSIKPLKTSSSMY